MNKLEHMKKQQQLFKNAIEEEMAVEGGTNKVEKFAVYKDEKKGVHHELYTTYRAFRGLCFATLDFVDKKKDYKARNYVFEGYEGEFYHMHYQVHKSMKNGREHNMFYITMLKDGKMEEIELYSEDFENMTPSQKELYIMAETVLENTDLIEHFENMDTAAKI